MYVDEVGNPDLGSSENPNHRFLSLTGVIVDLAHVESVIHPQLEALKRQYFQSHPDDPVILHRREIVNQRGPFQCLNDPDTRASFDSVLLDLLEKWDYTVVTVCIDKKKRCEQYRMWRYDPYHYCLAILVERFVFFLEQAKAVGDIMAESRGKKEDIRLKAAYGRLYSAGTNYVGAERFRQNLTSRELKVKQKSANVSGLQLADLIAHPSRNEILTESGYQGIKLAPFAQKLVALLRAKYHQPHGSVSGYGKKLL